MDDSAAVTGAANSRCEMSDTKNAEVGENNSTHEQLPDTTADGLTAAGSPEVKGADTPPKEGKESEVRELSRESTANPL